MNWCCSSIFILLCASMGQLQQQKINEIFKSRQKRYLLFEKGTAFTVQVNIAKSALDGAPRGLNEITEFTLMYDVPTELKQLHFKRKPHRTGTTSTSTTTEHPHYIFHSPFYYSHDLMSSYPGKEYQQLRNRKYWKQKPLKSLKCDRWHFQQFYGKPKKICLRRSKRVPNVRTLTTSERMFYDIIEKWSQIQGYFPRYCFMRTLCEARHLLLPHGLSLLHDLIRILLRFTTPWALQHETFGRSISKSYKLEECSALYGPHCRVSWLEHITNKVHGSIWNDLN